MYIRMSWGSIRSGYWDDYRAYYNERVATSTTDVKGLQQRQLLRSTENTDEGISMSLWDSMEDMTAYERSGHPERTASGSGPPSPTVVIRQG